MKGLEQDVESNHANPLVLPACANQYYEKTTRSHNFTCKLHFSPEGKTVKFAQKHCLASVYNIEHVRGYRK